MKRPLVSLLSQRSQQTHDIWPTTHGLWCSLLLFYGKVFLYWEQEHRPPGYILSNFLLPLYFEVWYYCLYWNYKHGQEVQKRMIQNIFFHHVKVSDAQNISYPRYNREWEEKNVKANFQIMLELKHCTRTNDFHFLQHYRIMPGQCMPFSAILNWGFAVLERQTWVRRKWETSK